MCSKLYKHESDCAIPPGLTIKENMEYKGYSQKEFAQRLELSPQSLNRIFNGEQAITHETASKLEKVIGVSASFWNKLENNYREALQRIKENDLAQSKKDWLLKFPIKILKARGYIESEDLFSLLSFFNVATIGAWENIWHNPSMAARRSICFENNPYYAATWVRMSEIEASKENYSPTNKRDFLKVINEIRELTTNEPKAFIPKMKELCKKSGVALVLTPEFPKLTWQGCTKWLDDTAMIVLNLRGKHEDKFWFTFFHEAYHVIYDKKELFIYNSGNNEQKANHFAQMILFKNNDYLNQIAKINSKQEVKNIAKELNLSEGIVVAQYHFLTKDYKNYNKLIKSYTWSE